MAMNWVYLLLSQVMTYIMIMLEKYYIRWRRRRRGLRVGLPPTLTLSRCKKKSKKKFDNSHVIKFWITVFLQRPGVE